MDQVEYARLLKGLLPEGPAWPHETDETSDFDGVIKALAVEPSRLEADALLLLDNLIPDNANTSLVAWERLVGSPTTSMTDEERLARIRGLLRGNTAISRVDLEAAIQEMSPGSALFNRFRPSFAAGASTAGDACGTHAFIWACELYPNTLASALNDFSSWSGITSYSANNAYSPVTLLQNADSGTIQSATPAQCAFEADDDTLGYFVVWLKPATNVTVTLQIRQRDGSTLSTGASHVLPAGRWYRLTHRDSVGSGGNSPRVSITVNTNTAFAFSWALAGEADEALEERVTALVQLHTRGVFGCHDEFETLLEQDPLEVCY